MTDIEIKAILNAYEGRIYQLEQKIEHMADVGDTVEVEWKLYDDVYEMKHVKIMRIIEKKK